MSNIFSIPGRILYGEDALKNGVSFFPQGRALIVTGNTVRKQTAFSKLINLLDSHGIVYTIFSDTGGEPTDEMAEKGLKAYTENGCGYLIAVGGGTPMDLMKAIAVMSASGKNICDFNGKNIKMPVPFMIAIPTTAGTGSEATRFSVITDTRQDIKMLLNGESLIPALAILDTDFTMSSPPHVTAQTGLDALTHAVESYTSRKAQPLTDTLALSAVQRIFTYLPRAYRNGNDREARSQMSLAALEAGICINNASVTIVHGMSRPIGALFHVPHGLSNAMLLSKCLEFALPGAPVQFANLGRGINAAKVSDSDETAAGLFLRSVEELCQICEIPTLHAYHVPRDAFFSKVEKMAGDAIASGSPANTRRDITKQDIIEIYASLWS